MRKSISREAALEVIKKMFKNGSEKSMSVHEIYTTWGRDLNNLTNNRKWLSGKLKYLKAYRLISTIYSYENGIKKLEKVQLTSEAMEELKRTDRNTQAIQESVQIYSSQDIPTLDDIMLKIAQLKKNHPDYEIVFDVKLKGA